MPAETLSFDIFANDRASEVFRRLGLSAENVSGDVKELGDRLNKLGARVTTARVSLDGGKEVNVELDKIDLRLIRLGKRVASPYITVEGKIKALADITAVDLAMDRLNSKFAGGIRVREGAGGGSGLLGILSAIGGIRFGGGGIGNIASGLLGSFRGGGAGGAAGGGGAGAGGIGAAGAAAALLAGPIASVIDAIIGFGTGAGVAGAGFGLAEKFTPAALAPGLGNITKTLSTVTQSFAPSLGLMLVQFGKLFQGLAPQLAKLFGASLPFMQAFFNVAGQGAKVILPALTQVLQQMVKSGALNAIAQSFVILLQGLAGFLKAIGPGFKTGALIIRGFAVVVRTLLFGLGATLGWLGGITGKTFARWHLDFDHARHDVAGAFDAIRGALLSFGGFWVAQWDGFRHTIANFADGLRAALGVIGHDIATAFDAVRHAFATIGHDIASAFDSVRHAQGVFDAFGKDLRDVDHGIAIAFDALRHATAATWDKIAAVVGESVARIVHDFDTFRHNVAAIFDGLRHDIAAAWDAIWRVTTTAVRDGVAAVVNFFKALPGKVIGALSALGRDLFNAGHMSLTDFLHGLESIAGSVLSWIGNFISTVWNKVKKFFGFSSPSALFFALGKSLMQGLEKGIQAHAQNAANAARSAGQRVANAAGGPVSASAAQAQAYARSRLAAFGWGASEMGALIALWNQESGWNRFARNPSSGAYGIPQALPPGKMGAAANPPTSSAAAQINWGLGYIKGRYGTPSGAEAHERAFGWYDRGGWLPPGMSLAYNTSGHPEMVVPHGSSGTHVVLEVRGGGSGDLDRLFATWLRKYIRVHGGGSVQTALGHP